MKKKQHILIKALAAISFVLALVEGCFYYSDLGQFSLLKAMMILQNAIKAFLMNPIISIQMVLNDLQNGATTAELVVAYTYSVAVFTAPLCTAAAIFSAIRYLLHRRVSASINKDAEAIYVFGWQEDVQLLLKNRKNAHEATPKSFFRMTNRYPETIHIITPEPVSEELELRYFQEGVFFHSEDCLLLPKEKLKAFLEHIELKRAHNIILFEGSAPRNLSLYWAIKGCGVELNAKTTFYLSCDHAGTRRIIEECDKAIKPADKKDSTQENLKLFSIPELKTRQIYQEKPLYTYNISGLDVSDSPDWDVHLLIAGFGSIGKQVLRQTVQLGVMSSENEILIDVVDKNADEEKSIFESAFNDEYIDAAAPDNEVRICAPGADGLLRIRFHKLDIRRNGFQKKIRELSAEKPFTYVAVCTQNADVTMHCMTEVENFLQDHQIEGKKTPVAVRLEFERQIAEYLKEDQGSFHDVFPIGVNQDVLKLESIFDLQTEQECRAFNYLYDRIYATVIEQHKRLKLNQPTEDLIAVSDSWNQLPYYKKEGNRYLSYHGNVKEMLISLGEWKKERPRGVSFEKYLEEKRADLKQAAIRTLGSACREDGTFVIDGSFFQKKGSANSEVVEYARLEHRRWCYFMAMNGWGYTQGAKDDKRRLTPYLCEWQTLQKQDPDVCANDLIPMMIMIWMQKDMKASPAT